MASHDHERWASIARTLEASFGNQAAQAELNADEARSRNESEMSQHHGISENNRASLEHAHDEQSKKHTASAAANRVRARHWPC
jgi:hypothetical protein